MRAQTTLVIVESIDQSSDLRDFVHPNNATYMLGTEAKGISKSDVDEIQQYFKRLNQDIPEQYIGKHDKTAHLAFVKIATPQSLNLGVCASIVMYDRHSKT